jgi:hypothetical protein
VLPKISYPHLDTTLQLIDFGVLSETKRDVSFLQSCLTAIMLTIMLITLILCKRDSGLSDWDFRMQSGDSFQNRKRFGFARFGRGGARRNEKQVG